MMSDTEPENVVPEPNVEVDETPDEREAKELREALENEESELVRTGAMPYIDGLDDAIVDGEFIVPVGERVIIERIITIGSKTSWLDTKVYIVREIDLETGILHLNEPEMRQSAMSNYITGPKRGCRFKVADKKTRLSGRGRAKEPKESTKRATPVKSSTTSRPGSRRVYSTREVIHTRLKGMAFVAPETTKAVPGDRVEVTPPTEGRVNVVHLDGWTEVWLECKDM